MSHRSAYDVLVAGEYFCDLVFSGLDGPPRLGEEHMATGLTVVPGGTYTMALALTRLGVRTCWASSFGTDLFSSHVRARAAADDLDPSGFTIVDGDVQRVSVAYAAQGERGFISFSQPSVEPPPPAIAAIKPLWLLQTFRFEPQWLTFVRQKKSDGAKVLLDCRGGDFSLTTPGVADLIGLADIFSPNAEEAQRLTGRSDLEDAARAVAELCPLVVVKAGADGALVASHGRIESYSTRRVEIVDTIGAGDCFNAGLLSGLVAGQAVPDAVARAIACGTLSTLGKGGAAAPTFDALASFLSQPSSETGPYLPSMPN
jgi:sugar/nucleoside kinase (ribokinase family)